MPSRGEIFQPTGFGKAKTVVKRWIEFQTNQAWKELRPFIKCTYTPRTGSAAVIRVAAGLNPDGSGFVIVSKYIGAGEGSEGPGWNSHFVSGLSTWEECEFEIERLKEDLCAKVIDIDQSQDHANNTNAAPVLTASAAKLPFDVFVECLKDEAQRLVFISNCPEQLSEAAVATARFLCQRTALEHFPSFSSIEARPGLPYRIIGVQAAWLVDYDANYSIYDIDESRWKRGGPSAIRCSAFGFPLPLVAPPATFLKQRRAEAAEPETNRSGADKPLAAHDRRRLFEQVRSALGTEGEKQSIDTALRSHLTGIAPGKRQSEIDDIFAFDEPDKRVRLYLFASILANEQGTPQNLSLLSSITQLFSQASLDGKAVFISRCFGRLVSQDDLRQEREKWVTAFLNEVDSNANKPGDWTQSKQVLQALYYIASVSRENDSAASRALLLADDLRIGSGDLTLNLLYRVIERELAKPNRVASAKPFDSEQMIRLINLLGDNERVEAFVLSAARHLEVPLDAVFDILQNSTSWGSASEAVRSVFGAMKDKGPRSHSLAFIRANQV